MGTVTKLLAWVKGPEASAADLAEQLDHARAALDHARAAEHQAQLAFYADGGGTTLTALDRAKEVSRYSQLHLERAESLLADAQRREQERHDAEVRGQVSARVAQRDQLLDQVAQHQRRQARLLVESIAAATRAAESMQAAAEQQRLAERLACQVGDPAPDGRAVSAAPSDFSLADHLLEIAARERADHRLVHALVTAVCPAYHRVRDIQAAAAHSAEVARIAAAERRAELDAEERQ